VVVRGMFILMRRLGKRRRRRRRKGRIRVLSMMGLRID